MMDNNVIESKKRDVPIDILKGLSIISVVCTHANISVYIAYFCLSVFNFVSGYNFKEGDMKIFFIKKVTRYYCTFVIVSLICLMITPYITVFIYDKNKIISIIKGIFLFNMDPVLMAPVWYILPLFIINILFYIFKKVLKNDMIILFISIMIFIFTCLNVNSDVFQFMYNNCSVMFNVGVGLLMFNLGYLFNKYKSNICGFVITCTGDLFILSAVVIYFIPKFVRDSNFRIAHFDGFFVLILSQFIGIYFTYYLSIWFYKKCKMFFANFLALIGKHSMFIMMFHFTFFAIANIVINLFTKKNIIWPEMYKTGYSKYVYFMFGLFGSLLLSICFFKIKNMIKYLLKTNVV